MQAEDRSIDQVYEDIWDVRDMDRWAALEPSLTPRSPAILFDLIRDIGLSERSRIVDVGCGYGDVTCDLAKQLNCRTIALDLVDSNLEKAQHRVHDTELTQLVTLMQGRIESLPFPDKTFSLVWCRHVLVHLASALEGLRECFRVLTPGGYMLLHTAFATERVEPREVALLCRRLSFSLDSMDRRLVEGAVQQAGFGIHTSLDLSSELAEFYELQDGRCARELQWIAKLHRAEASFVNQFGRNAYETALGIYHWQIFQMLGKINYHTFLLQRPA